MPRKHAKNATIEFDGPATIDELMEALGELRAQVGGHVTPRVRTKIALNAKGGCITSVTAERTANAGGPRD